MTLAKWVAWPGASVGLLHHGGDMAEQEYCNTKSEQNQTKSNPVKSFRSLFRPLQNREFATLQIGVGVCEAVTAGIPCGTSTRREAREPAVFASIKDFSIVRGCHSVRIAHAAVARLLWESRGHVWGI